jgi:hypothetical protein
MLSADWDLSRKHGSSFIWLGSCTTFVHQPHTRSNHGSARWFTCMGVRVWVCVRVCQCAPHRTQWCVCMGDQEVHGPLGGGGVASKRTQGSVRGAPRRQPRSSPWQHLLRRGSAKALPNASPQQGRLKAGAAPATALRGGATRTAAPQTRKQRVHANVQILSQASGRQGYASFQWFHQCTE